MNTDSWKVKSFDKCIKEIKYTNKIKRENYLPNGKYPIVSQEDSLISGYWEKEEDVFHVDTPLVIFGDHTRILKYIDFSFVLGADGVKILLPKDDLIAKFFYYYLVWYDIPNLGYSRHYKLLKEIEVLIPPITVQEKIVKELDTLSDIIAKKKEQLAELDKLAQATFYDMFGDPVENEKGWDIRELEKICTQIVDCPHSTPIKSETKTLYPCIRTSELKNGSINWDSMQYVEQEEYLKRTKRLIPKAGDIIYGREGSYGDAVCLPNTGHNFCLGQRTMLFRPNSQILNSIYLLKFIISDYVYSQAKNKNAGSTVGHVNVSDIKKFNILCPPLSLQNRFAEKIEAIEQQKALINQSINDTQLLFDYTMDKYFN